MKPLPEYDSVELEVRNKLGGFGSKLAERDKLQGEVDAAKARFELWFNREFSEHLERIKELDEQLEQLREWFNTEMERLYFSGRRSLFGKSVQPRTMIRVNYTDEEQMREWGEQFDEVWVLDKKVEPLRKAEGALLVMGRKDLLTVDMGKVVKIASATYESGEPIYNGPFELQETITQTSTEKLTRLINTFAIELEFDERMKNASK